MSRLEELGWTAPLAAAFGGLDAPDLAAGRVTEEHKGSFRVATEDGDWPAALGGRLRHDAAGREELPAVGDWVALRIDGGQGSIRHLLPRTSALVRQAVGARTEAQVVAANVDVVFFVLGLDRPFNPGAVERALALTRESGAELVLVLNKADVCLDPDAALAAAALAAPGVPVHLVSARGGANVTSLAAHLGTGRTGVLFGPSGVGKSTLVNRLLAAEAQVTGAVRDEDHRGRHTTTSRELKVLAAGGILIDTPGVREIGLWEAAAGIGSVFSEIEVLSGDCAFRDCAHGAEPGCAVREAIARGAIDERRIESYRKLEREATRVERRIDVRRRREEARRSHERLHRLRRRAEGSE